MGTRHQLTQIIPLYIQPTIKLMLGRVRDKPYTMGNYLCQLVCTRHWNDYLSFKTYNYYIQTTTRQELVLIKEKIAF